MYLDSKITRNVIISAKNIISVASAFGYDRLARVMELLVFAIERFNKDEAANIVNIILILNCISISESYRFVDTLNPKLKEALNNASFIFGSMVEECLMNAALEVNHAEY